MFLRCNIICTADEHDIMDAQYRRNHNENIEGIRQWCLRHLADGEYKGRYSVGKERITGNEHLPAEERRGTCYEENREVWMTMLKRGAKLMHGELRSRLAEWKDADEGKGMPIWHVWVEVGDMVYDRSNGKSLMMPKEMYYLRSRVQRSAEYPMRWQFDLVRDKSTVHLPAPHETAMVREIKAKQRTLGRDVRDYA
jgi:hypothetical protein